MWRQAGIERDAPGLEDALERLEKWEGYLARLGPFTRDGVEVVNMVQVAQLIALSALFRRESRGAHYRSDYPAPDPAWQAHSQVSWREGGLQLGTSPVASPAAVDDGLESA